MKVFETTRFSLCPFMHFFKWRGFRPKFTLIVEGDEIIMKVNENIELSRINKNEIHGFS